LYDNLVVIKDSSHSPTHNAYECASHSKFSGVTIKGSRGDTVAPLATADARSNAMFSNGYNQRYPSLIAFNPSCHLQ